MSTNRFTDARPVAVRSNGVYQMSKCEVLDVGGQRRDVSLVIRFGVRRGLVKSLCVVAQSPWSVAH